MLNIMKSDLYRILKGKTIYIVILVIILMSITSVIGMSAGHIGLSVGSNIDINNVEMLEKISNAKNLSDFRNIMKSFGNFELDKDIIGQNINLYYFFIAIIVTILCTDFNTKAIKNTLSSAITRKKYYYSKLILSIIICTILILFNNYFSYFLNLLVNGKSFSSNILDITKITFIQLPLLYGIISLLICFAFIFRKTSLFNTISIPFIMLIQLIVIGITNLFRLKADWFYNYEIQFALQKLTDNPTNLYISKCIILGIIYIIIFNLTGYYFFKKTEIK